MLQWIVRYLVPIVFPDALQFCVLGGLVGGLAVVVWWAFFSRAVWFERVGGILLMIAAMAVTPRILDKSVLTGMMGFMFFVLAIPVLSLAFVAWAVATRHLSSGLRRATMAATILLACGGWALLRTDGITGQAGTQLAWRWSPTAEDRLLASAIDKPGTAPVSLPSPVTTVTELPVAPARDQSTARLPNDALPAASPAPAKISGEPLAASRPSDPPATPIAASAGADWPGFRGPRRNSSVPGVRIETNWAASPPVEMWRRPVGPGWSSFAVRGDLIYTQEQRGGDEVVACYNLTTGKPVWSHRDAARFWESNAGAGPRGTPTLSNGRVYTFGGTGIVNALNAADGAVLWSRNASSDTGAKVPEWGFASSPLVVDDLVVVAAAGKLAAYDLPTGKPRWFGPNGRNGYSSPHPLTIDGVTQILLMSSPGVTSVSPADGKPLWEFALPRGTRIVQPALTADGDVLLSEGEGQGVHRVAIAHGPGGWTTEERWSSIGLKPYFSDFVIHNGHAFGFDGSILACIDVKDGKRKWKGGRYGAGQILLLPDQDVLLVLTEEGELALVGAAPDKFTELARFPAIKGKTWNHPVLAGDVLLARNGEEMVAFRLTLARR